MATISGRDINQVNFNGQEATVIVVNNQVQWVKPNYEQTFTVYGTTGNAQQTSPSGLSQYLTFQELYVGTEITQATITGDNSVSVNQGMLSYTLYGPKANQNVSARITLKKYREGSITTTLTSSTIQESFGKYPFSGSVNIGTGWTNVDVTAASSVFNSVSHNYNSSTGEVHITGYARRGGVSSIFTITYNNG